MLVFEQSSTLTTVSDLLEVQRTAQTNLRAEPEEEAQHRYILLLDSV